MLTTERINSIAAVDYSQSTRSYRRVKHNIMHSAFGLSS